MTALAHPVAQSASVSVRGRIAVQPFLERHGLRACMLAPTKIIAGLGMSLGIDRLTAPGATGAESPPCNNG